MLLSHLIALASPPDSGERSPVPLRNVFHDWPGPLRSGHFRHRSAGAALSLREALCEARQRGPWALSRRSIIRGGGSLHRPVLQCHVHRLCNLCGAKIDSLSNDSGRRPLCGLMLAQTASCSADADVIFHPPAPAVIIAGLQFDSFMNALPDRPPRAARRSGAKRHAPNALSARPRRPARLDQPISRLVDEMVQPSAARQAFGNGKTE